MSDFYDKYECVVGLEVHTQLSTKSKAFCADPYTYGTEPNTQVGPVSLAHPGTLPKFNKEALNMAIKMGLACHCEIHENTHFSRKNYFYADLPKGYQITQFTDPLCTGGYIIINDKEGNERRITLDKIICEEDSGKSIHDLDPFSSLVDLNRAGVPLIEIVSQPDIRFPEEAYQYLMEVRKIVRYLGICDGNMEEGSLRCDANVSIRKKGETILNTRVEIKNLNSMRHVQKAIEYEIHRQRKVYEAGGTVSGDTMGFDAVKGETYLMRSKEMANDYRYFPEPDIPPVIVKPEEIQTIKAAMPMLPRELQKDLVESYKLTPYDAAVITAEKESADYFLTVSKLTRHYKSIANWLNGPMKNWLNENALSLTEIKLTPEKFAELVNLVEEGKIAFSTASQHVFPVLMEKESASTVLELVESMNLLQTGDDDTILSLIQQALAKYPEKVAEYKAGKKGVIGLFMGEVVKLSGGKADPKKANQLLAAELEK